MTLILPLNRRETARYHEKVPDSANSVPDKAEKVPDTMKKMPNSSNEVLYTTEKIGLSILLKCKENNAAWIQIK
jgi:hypothetical protein